MEIMPPEPYEPDMSSENRKPYISLIPTNRYAYGTQNLTLTLVGRRVIISCHVTIYKKVIHIHTTLKNHYLEDIPRVTSNEDVQAVWVDRNIKRDPRMSGYMYMHQRITYPQPWRREINRALRAWLATQSDFTHREMRYR